MHILRRLLLHPFSTIRSLYYNIIRKISNLIFWIPIIINDYPWDTTPFFFTVVGAKLKRVHKAMEQNKWIYHNDKEIKTIKDAILMAKRLEDHSFHFEMALKRVGIEPYNMSYISWEPIIYKGEKHYQMIDSRPKEEIDKHSRAIKHSRMHYDSDYKIFMETLSKNLFRWYS